nr:hypothetical protein [Tanacetum cinerariifolium]
LVNEPNKEPAHSEPELKLVHQGEGDEDDMELEIQMSLESFQAQSQAHISGVAIREPIAEATRPLLVVEGKGIITSTNVDYAELLWEEFVQAIQTFLIDKANLGSPTKKEFTIFIKDQHLRFILLKKTSDWAISSSFQKAKLMMSLEFQFQDELISNNIRNAPYYNAYLEMVTKHDWKMSAEKEGTKKTVSVKQHKSKPVV